MADETSSLIELTAEIVAAHVSHNRIPAAELPELIQNVFAALSSAQAPAVPDAAPQEPAVSVRSSVKHDYIVCLEDGAKLKMLRRYLRKRFDMSPEDYRAKWNLPRDYPMVAPAYAEQRRSIAHQVGLGRKREAVVADVIEPAPARRKAAKPSPETDTADASQKKRGRPPKAPMSAVVEPASDTDAA